MATVFILHLWKWCWGTEIFFVFQIIRVHQISGREERSHRKCYMATSGVWLSVWRSWLSRHFLPHKKKNVVKLSSRTLSRSTGEWRSPVTHCLQNWGDSLVDMDIKYTCGSRSPGTESPRGTHTVLNGGSVCTSPRESNSGGPSLIKAPPSFHNGDQSQVPSSFCSGRGNEPSWSSWSILFLGRSFLRSSSFARV